MNENNNNELLDFKRKAVNLGLCGRYKTLWDKCCTKKELIDMALDANGAEFMADAIAFGWGLSEEYLTQEFREYINGKYQRVKNGYTGEMYVGVSGIAKLKSTITLIAYCENLEIDIPETFVGKVYICGNSRVNIKSKGCVELYEYGHNDVMLYPFSTPYTSYKVICKSMWTN